MDTQATQAKIDPAGQAPVASEVQANTIPSTVEETLPAETQAATEAKVEEAPIPAQESVTKPAKAPVSPIEQAIKDAKLSTLQEADFRRVFVDNIPIDKVAADRGVGYDTVAKNYGNAMQKFTKLSQHPTKGAALKQALIELREKSDAAQAVAPKVDDANEIEGMTGGTKSSFANDALASEATAAIMTGSLSTTFGATAKSDETRENANKKMMALRKELKIEPKNIVTRRYKKGMPAGTPKEEMYEAVVTPIGKGTRTKLKPRHYMAEAEQMLLSETDSDVKAKLQEFIRLADLTTREAGGGINKAGGKRGKIDKNYRGAPASLVSAIDAQQQVQADIDAVAESPITNAITPVQAKEGDTLEIPKQPTPFQTASVAKMDLPARKRMMEEFIEFKRNVSPGMPHTAETSRGFDFVGDLLMGGKPDFSFPSIHDAEFLISKGYDSVEVGENGHVMKLENAKHSTEELLDLQAALKAAESAQDIDIEHDLKYAARRWEGGVARHESHGNMNVPAWDTLDQDFRENFALAVSNADLNSSQIATGVFRIQQDLNNLQVDPNERQTTSDAELSEPTGISEDDGEGSGGETSSVDEERGASKEAPRASAPLKRSKADSLAFDERLKRARDTAALAKNVAPLPDSYYKPGRKEESVNESVGEFDPAEYDDPLAAEDTAFAETEEVEAEDTTETPVGDPDAAALPNDKALLAFAEKLAKTDPDGYIASMLVDYEADVEMGMPDPDFFTTLKNVLATEHGLEFSTDAAPPTNASVEDVRAWISKAVGKLNNTIEVKVVPDVAALRKEANLSGAPDTARGVRNGNKVYLVANRLDAKSANEVLAHETIGHIGLEGVMGKSGMNGLFNSVEQLERSNNAYVRAAAAQVDANYQGATRTERLKEILAHLAEKNPDMGVVKRAINAVRMWLAKHGFGNLREAQVRDALVKAAQHVRTGKVVVDKDGRPQFSLAGGVNAATAEAFMRNVTRGVGRASKMGAKRAQYAMSFTEDLADYAVLRNEQLGGAINKVMDLLRRRQVTQNRLKEAGSEVMRSYSELSEGDRGKVNAYLIKSTQLQKWGYQPSWDQTAVVDAAMWNEFHSMDKKLRDIIIGSNKVMADNHAVKVKYITDLAAVDGVDTAFLAKLNGPYSPIKRHGKYVVTAMSDTLQAAVNADNKTEVNKLKRDPDHYFVEFVENELGAIKLRDQLSNGSLRNTDYFVKAAWNDNPLFGMSEFSNMSQEIQRRAHSADPDFAKQIDSMLRDIELSMLAQDHARTNERQRRNIAGSGTYNSAVNDTPRDMMHAFGEQVEADAHYIGNLEHVKGIGDAVRVMTSMASKPLDGMTRNEAQQLTNEIYRRYLRALDYTPTDIQDRLVAFNAAWNLTTNPSYYIQNATQPFTMSIPYMAKTFGFKKSLDVYLGAYGSLKEMVMSGKFSSNEVHQFDIKLAGKTTDETAMITELLERGRLDPAMGSELGTATIGSKGVINETTAWYDRTIKRLPGMMEAINRTSTALAAYRLAVERGASAQEATNYADKVIRVTHGNYDGLNAPSILTIKGIPSKVLFQYRKFQFIQGSFFARLLHQAVMGGENSTALDDNSRMAAIKALGYTLLPTLAVSGARGLPAISSIIGFYSLLGAVFGDDDKVYSEEEIVRKARKGMKDAGAPDTLIDLVMNGAPTLVGVNATNIVGMNNLLSLFPFVDTNLSNKDLKSDLALAALGPTGSLFGKAIDGAQLMRDGEYVRGLEKMTPKGITNLLTSARLSTRGETSMNGDVMLSPDDIGVIQLALTAIGLPTLNRNKRWEMQTNKMDHDTLYDSRTAAIKRGYYEAVKNRDGAAKRSYRQQFQSLQTERRRNGYTAKPISDLTRSVTDRGARAKDQIGGVKYDKESKRFVKNMANAYGM